MRGRGKNPNANPGVRPVEKIELSEKNPKKRIIIAAMLLVIGLVFIGIGIFRLLESEEGWTEIEATSTGESVASDLTFFYELGAADRSPTAEQRELTILYDDLCGRAYKIFNSDYAFDDVNNIHYINHHIGEDIKIDPELYEVLSLVESYNSRFIYAAPFYTEYKNMFSDSEDYSASELDPYKNEEIAAYFAELSEFTKSEDHVSLDLLGDNTVKLNVSDEFRAYAKAHGIDTYIDLYWAKNAFVIDYIADELSQKGFVYGCISSFDGFMRTMDTRDIPYSYNLYDLRGNDIYAASRIEYTGKSSLVFLRSYQMNGRDEIYHVYESGETRHAYVDVNDGLCKSSLNGLVSYSYTKGCGEVLLSMMPVYIANKFDHIKIASMQDGGVYSIYFNDTSICHNDSTLKFFDVYSDDSVKYVPIHISNKVE